MEAPTFSKPAKDKTCQGLALLITLTLLVLHARVTGSPPIPKELTWQVFSQTGDMVWSITGFYPPGTWWPNLSPDFCQLAAALNTWDIAAYKHNQLTLKMEPTSGGDGMEGCSNLVRRCLLAATDFYVCPRDGRNQATAHWCGGYGEYFCASWGCETTGDAYWKPSSSWDKIIVHRGWEKPPDGKILKGDCRHGTGNWRCTTGYCLPLNISFTSQGKHDYQSWLKGHTWGLRWYMLGDDRGVTFKIQLKIGQTDFPLGPNPILPDQRTLTQTRPKKPEVPVPPSVTTISPVAITTDTEGPTLPPGTGIDYIT